MIRTMIRTKTILWGVAGVALIVVGCSQAGPSVVAQDASVSSGGSMGTGGSAAGTGGAAQGSGGADTGTGGSQSGSGGTSANTGGAAAGTGGTSTGTGGATAGTGGTGGTGATNIATGGSSATGGANGTGGATSTGGTLGTGGAGGVTVASVVGDMDGFLWSVNCSGPGAALDCDIFEENGTSCPNRTAAWPMRGAFRRVVKKVGGTPGVVYWVNFHVRGVVGAKYYSGGTRRSAVYNNGEAGNDAWHVGGMPTETLYNTYEIHVSPAPPVANYPGNYYLNSFPTTSGYERHETYVMKYSASFPVIGGTSSITFTVHDSNCLGQKNCGPTPGTECRGPRTIDLTGMTPQPPGTFRQPYMTTYGTPQWLFFDVQSVTLAPPSP